jgi:hypothetical protein
MCLQAGFAMFRSTQEQQPNPSINSYFSSQRVQVALETMEQQADLGGPTGSIDSLGEKLQLVQERMQRLAASSLDTLRSQMVPAAGSAASSLVSRVTGALAPGMAAADSTPGADSSQAPSAAAGAGGLMEPAAGSRPVAMPELLPAEQDLLQQQQQKGGMQPLRMAVAAGVLAVGVVGAGWLWRAVSAAGSSNALPPAAAMASRYPAMDVSGATKLIQQFQKAKARALGSEYDCSQLSSVLMGAALQQYHSTAQELAARGWFRTSRLWKCVVHRVTPVTASGQKVVAQVRGLVAWITSWWGMFHVCPCLGMLVLQASVRLLQTAHSLKAEYGNPCLCWQPSCIDSQVQNHLPSQACKKTILTYLCLLVCGCRPPSGRRHGPMALMASEPPAPGTMHMTWTMR